VFYARVLSIAISLVLARLALGQDASPPLPKPEPPRVLVGSGRVSFQIPGFGASGKVNCDASGNLYFDVSNAFPAALHEAGPYLKIEEDGRKHQIFVPKINAEQVGDTTGQQGGAQKDSDGTDGVSPDGTFYILLHRSDGNELQRFKDDGSFVRSTHLDLPSGLDIRYWAIQNSGVAYVSGYLDSVASEAHAAIGYAALIAPSGKLIATLSGTSSQIHTEPGPPHPPDGDVTAGTDGRFYILDSNRVFVVTQSGEIQNTFPLVKPNPDAFAARIDVSGGMISVLFYTLTPRKGKPPFPEASAELLNSQTES